MNNIQIGGNHVVRNFLGVIYFRMELRPFLFAAMRRQQFLSDCADRQHLTTQRDLAGHCRICAHPDFQSGRETGAFYRVRRLDRLGDAFRHVNVDIAFFVKVRINAVFARARKSAPPEWILPSLHRASRCRSTAFARVRRRFSMVNRSPPAPSTQAVTLTYAVSLSRAAIIKRATTEGSRADYRR